MLKRQTYRVYEAAVGSDLVFCGELDDLTEARKFANSEPAGLPRSLWDTARVAGHDLAVAQRKAALCQRLVRRAGEGQEQFAQEVAIEQTHTRTMAQTADG